MTYTIRGVTRSEFRGFYGDGVYRHESQVPEELLEQLRPGGRRDYFGFLARGLDWLAEPLKVLQPHSYEALCTWAGPLEVGAKMATRYFPTDPPAAFRAAMFESCGRMIEIVPSFGGATFEWAMTALVRCSASPATLRIRGYGAPAVGEFPKSRTMDFLCIAGWWRTRQLAGAAPMTTSTRWAEAGKRDFCRALSRSFPIALCLLSMSSTAITIDLIAFWTRDPLPLVAQPETSSLSYPPVAIRSCITSTRVT